MTDPDVTAPAGRAAPRRWWLIGAIALGVLVVDQLTKWWALEELATRTIDVVWTLRFHLARNPGAAFSLGAGSGITRFLPLAVLVVVGVVIWRGRAALTRSGAVALGMIVGGAVGNIVDRALRADGGDLFSGAVVDFIDLQWWPVFNVADAAVVCGGILLVVSSFWHDRAAAGDGSVTDGAEAPASGSGS